jgi:hypothetical protein
VEDGLIGSLQKDAAAVLHGEVVDEPALGSFDRGREAAQDAGAPLDVPGRVPDSVGVAARIVRPSITVCQELATAT